MKKIFVVLMSLLTLVSFTSRGTEARTDERHLRGAWISTVINLDWPSGIARDMIDDEARIRKSKEELIMMLDTAVSHNMNAIFFQVSPEGDALYRSDIVPWSRYLTGTFGKDPGFDPLQFVIDESRKRNLEVHAWFNPYRISMYTNEDITESLKIDKSIFKEKPGWVRTAKDRYVVDPGVPGAKDWVKERVMEVVENYDVDGIHFDDYFYYESEQDELKDTDTYEKYNDGRFSNKADWRRNNTYEMVAEISEAIAERKPWIKFGVSPSGVWANKKDGHPDGSNTSAGLTHYDKSFADTRKWIEDEIIDYVAPQIYFSTANGHAPYEHLVEWWEDVVDGKNVHLYIGQALYKIDNDSDEEFNGENAIAEFKYQSRLNELRSNGSIMFRFNNLYDSDKQAVVNTIKNDMWREKALIPEMGWKGGVIPDNVQNSSIQITGQGAKLSWSDSDENTAYYAIYRLSENSRRLIGTVRKEGSTSSFIDRYNTGDRSAIYQLTSLDRLHNESEGTFVGEFQSKHFLDVGRGAPWAVEAIDYLYEGGVVKGTGNGMFSPSMNIRRADFLIMAMNAYGIGVEENTGDNFLDAGDTYYTDYLATAKTMGLVDGVGDNRFIPQGDVSRQDMFLILYRILDRIDKLPGNLGEAGGSSSTGLDSFTDGHAVAEYAYEAMKFFVERGIVKGDGINLRPADKSNRAEGAQTLYNLIR